MSEAFSGFRPEAIDFLWQLRFNNNRDWFSAHKQTYLEALYRPLVAFSEEIFTPFAGRSGYCMKVSRIYRDARFAHAAPYKESLWLCIRRGETYWGEEPSLFFEITPEGYNYGFVLWGPRAAWMQVFRARLAAKPGEFLALCEDLRRKTGLALTGDRYKRQKPCSDARLAPWWNLKNLMAISRHPVDDGLYDTALPARVRETLSALDPLYAWCQGISANLSQT
ncbi:MAG: DUF2461 domain-containing protein [Oscillospiraceae bacterium]|nr:DUF2461 domain-containing protein [Oscillospiraceae bacterium]